jgi:hypothetical protein
MQQDFYRMTFAASVTRERQFAKKIVFRLIKQLSSYFTYKNYKPEFHTSKIILEFLTIFGAELFADTQFFIAISLFEVDFKKD